jgi:hypothetical protein
MKKEYDFSTAERGKFYRPDLSLNLPIYLEKDVAEFVRDFARSKRVDAQTAVNRLLREKKSRVRVSK